ncbi:MAG: protein phosphatase CheZ [Burkholderiales bacterium]
MTGMMVDHDNGEDLDALFERVAAESCAAERNENSAPAVMSAAAEMPPDGDEKIFRRVGQLARTLHNALHELGYDHAIESAASFLPDTRDRLTYIATLTGQAAERVLSAVEHGQGLQRTIESDAQTLDTRWQRLYAGQLSVEEFRQLAGDTRDFIGGLPQRAQETHAQLLEIMMAQDFHDLTGQVIKKVVELARNLETQLVALLIETSRIERPDGEGLSGPVVRAEGRNDVVTDQQQVDELLGSLGF